MNTPAFAGCEFISASTAGIVTVELGFVPDFVWFIGDHLGTSPLEYRWINSLRFPGWVAAHALFTTDSTGATIQDATSITVYAGGDTITIVETDNGQPSVPTFNKHVHQLATGGSTFAAVGRVTAPGVIIPADHQVASGRNMVLAFRANM